jgi:integrase
VTVADLERYYSRLTDQGVNPPSIVKVHVVLAGALGLAERWGAIDKNPARLASAPTVEATEVDPPDPVVLATQLVALLEEHPAMGAWVLSAAATGMRPGEQCGLRWSDLDLDAGVAEVRRAVRKDGRGGWEIATTKTKKVRRVALGRKVVDLYRLLCDRQLEQCASLGVPWDPDGYVFMVDATRPVFTNPHLWRQRWTKRRSVEVDGEQVERSLREQYGLAGVRLYALRHFAATHMVADGHDPVTIGRLLGHNPSMLLSRYAHPISENARAAVDALDRKLSV